MLWLITNLQENLSLYKCLKYKFVQNSESPWNKKKKTKRNSLESVSIISCTMKDYFLDAYAIHLHFGGQ